MKSGFLIAILCSLLLLISCASSEKKWGKEFDLEGKWWEQNAQSYDPNTKIFMATGMSRGNYNSIRLERDSADMDARKQIANFMQTMVTTYMKESSKNNVDTSENIVKAVSEEVLVGSAFVARHYSESDKIYYSLVKIDLKYFFDKVKDKVIDSANKTLMDKYRELDPDKREKEVESEIDELKQKVEVVEKSVSKVAEEVNKTTTNEEKK
jgi:hypothetical protein